MIEDSFVLFKISEYIENAFCKLFKNRSSEEHMVNLVFKAILGEIASKRSPLQIYRMAVYILFLVNYREIPQKINTKYVKQLRITRFLKMFTTR